MLADPNHNSSQPFSPGTSSSRPSKAAANAISQQEGSNDSRFPMEYLLLQSRGVPSAVQRGYKNVCFRDTTTFIKFIQLFVINISMFILSQMNIVKDFVNPTTEWSLYALLTIQVVVWLIDENITHTLETEKGKLYFTCIVNIIHTLCLSYMATFLYVYIPSVFVPLGIASISVLYFGFFLFCTPPSARPGIRKLSHQHKDNVHLTHFRVTRPETQDIRLNVGPQLVFPIPEDFSMPGVGIGFQQRG